MRAQFFCAEEEGVFIMEVHVVLYDDFDMMDAMGPAEVFGRAPQYFHVDYLSAFGNVVNSMQGLKVWTEPLEPGELEGILVVPGGRGARRLLYQDQEMLQSMKKAAQRAQTCLMVGNGSALLAQTGVLYRRKIAESRMEEDWKRMFMAGVSMVPGASWVEDGKFFSSADAMSGIAMALGVVADFADFDLAVQIAGQLGYEWDAEDENIYR